MSAVIAILLFLILLAIAPEMVGALLKLAAALLFLGVVGTAILALVVVNG